jgi:hypothetical protein
LRRKELAPRAVTGVARAKKLLPGAVAMPVLVAKNAASSKRLAISFMREFLSKSYNSLDS